MAYGKHGVGKERKWQAYDPEVWMAGTMVQCFCYDKTPIFKYVGTPLQADAKSDLINAGWLAGIHAMVAKVESTGLTSVQQGGRCHCG